MVSLSPITIPGVKTGTWHHEWEHFSSHPLSSPLPVIQRARRSPALVFSDDKNMTYFGQKKIVWNHKLYQEAIEAWKSPIGYP